MKEYKIMFLKDGELKTLYFISEHLMIMNINQKIKNGWELIGIKEV